MLTVVSLGILLLMFAQASSWALAKSYKTECWKIIYNHIYILFRPLSP